MRLLLFSDLHCDVEAAEQLVELAANVDAVVGAGDFGSLRRNVESVCDVLALIEKPSIVVPGNNESLDELVAACGRWKSVHVLHGTGASIDGVDFYGIGGGIPVTPFGAWSYDFDEEQAAAMLDGCPSHGVLVSHSPPKGCVDVSLRGVNLGSTSLRTAIEVKRPALVVCGHIHDCAGQVGSIKDTTVVNAGPAGIIWDLCPG